jgi:hypothetical protein
MGGRKLILRSDGPESLWNKELKGPQFRISIL